MQRVGHRPTATSVAALLVALVLLHHTGSLSLEHSPEMDHGMGSGAAGGAMSLCLAIVGLGALALAVPRPWSPMRRRPHRDPRRGPGLRYLSERLAVPARAGPLALLQVFRL